MGLVITTTSSSSYSTWTSARGGKASGSYTWSQRLMDSFKGVTSMGMASPGSSIDLE